MEIGLSKVHHWKVPRQGRYNERGDETRDFVPTYEGPVVAPIVAPRNLGSLAMSY